jgi:hypothetical protein
VRDELLKERHPRAKTAEANAHLMHAFRIAMDDSILVGGEVMQAGKTDGLKGLARRHCGMENDLICEGRPVLVGSAERIAALGLGLRAVAGCRVSRDPTLTHGKDARRAKEIELAGWDYPRHLAGRYFSVVVHGDVEGAESVPRSLSDWLCSMQLIPAGPLAELDRYIGYWKPYAASHQELDADVAIQEEVRNAARTLLEAVIAHRGGTISAAGADLKPPRQK